MQIHYCLLPELFFTKRIYKMIRSSHAYIHTYIHIYSQSHLSTSLPLPSSSRCYSTQVPSIFSTSQELPATVDEWRSLVEEWNATGGMAELGSPVKVSSASHLDIPNFLGLLVLYDSPEVRHPRIPDAISQDSSNRASFQKALGDVNYTCARVVPIYKEGHVATRREVPP